MSGRPNRVNGTSPAPRTNLLVAAFYLSLAGLALGLLALADSQGWVDVNWWVSVPIWLLGGSFLTPWLQTRIRRRRLGRGVVECALRDPHTAGRARRWRGGTMTASPRQLIWTPGGPGGLRYPRGEPATIHVHQLTTGPTHELGFRDTVNLIPGFQVITATTDDGTVLEIAGPPDGLDWLQRQVADPDPRNRSQTLVKRPE